METHIFAVSREQSESLRASTRSIAGREKTVEFVLSNVSLVWLACHRMSMRLRPLDFDSIGLRSSNDQYLPRSGRSGEPRRFAYFMQYDDDNL